MSRFALAVLLGVLVLGGCPNSGQVPVDDDSTGDDDDSSPYDGPRVGLLGDDPVYPYPSIHLMAEDGASATGYRVDFEDGMLPQSVDGSSLDLERMNLRDGFSPANTSVVRWADADIDPGCLPPLSDLSISLDPGVSVQIFDLDAGERVPGFAELDAHPDCTGPADRTLLVRPMRALPFGSHVAVVLTDALVDTAGAPIPAPERFAALRDGGEVAPGLAAYVDHYETLFTRLEELGLARGSLTLAWDFYVATEDVIHRPLDRVLEAVLEEMPADPVHDPAYTIDWVSDTDEGFELNEHSWRLAQGKFTLPNFLADDREFVLDEEGIPIRQGNAEVYYMAMVPESLHDAPAGSAPLVLFGHGIFASPYSYLGKDDDPESVLALADRLGAIMIGTKWRGLTTDDMPAGIEVANDFGKFSLITDKLTQGLGNTAGLARLVQTTFLDAPFLQSADGGGSLVDPSRIHYMGISLGGIEGATLMANIDDIDHAVLHVPGAVWSTMLERSSNWTLFEGYMSYGMPDPANRQLMYSVSQLMWDPVDPITHTHGMAGRSLLWQQSLGDEQVPNMTLDALIRSLDVPLLAPAVEPVVGVEEADAPLGPDAAALMQFDPQKGRPAEENRPAEVTGAHKYIRHTEEVHAQIEAFFAEGSEGTIIHPCGDEPCVYDD